MHLRKLQIQLVRHAAIMYRTKKDSNEWEKILDEYSKSLYHVAAFIFS